MVDTERHLSQVSEEELTAARVSLKHLMGMLRHRYGTDLVNAAVFKDVRNKNGERVKPTCLSGIYSGSSSNLVRGISENIGELLYAEGNNSVEHQRRLWEITRVFHPTYSPRLTLAYLKMRVQNAQTVYILSTYLRYFETLAPLLRDVRNLRILLMSHESEFLEVRSKQLYQTREEFADRISENLMSLSRHDIDFNAVRQYRSAPSFPIYRFDDDIYCGFYSHGREAADGPQRHFRADSDYGEEIIKEFDTIWDDQTGSQTVTKTILENHPLPRSYNQVVQGLVPERAKSITPLKLKSIKNNMGGMYQFARLYDTKDEPHPEKIPVISGLLQIHTHEECADDLTFSARLPIFKTNHLKEEVEIEGRIIPYHDFVLLIGETHRRANGRSYPVIMALQTFTRTKENWDKIFPRSQMLREHANGYFLGSRMVLRCLPETTFMDAKREHFKHGTPYLDRMAFNDRFKMSIEDLRDGWYDDEPGLLKLQKFTLNKQDIPRPLIRPYGA